MPRKLSPDIAVPTFVQQRLVTWGRCIRAQRVRQRMTAADLAVRVQVSRATIARLERGDPGAAVSAYLSALLVLGVFDDAAPELAPALWADASRSRVRPAASERAGGADDDWF